MTLRRRLFLTTALVSVPVAIALYSGVQWLRTRDLTTALQRFATAQINDGVRADCEDYPQWFLAGPRDPRPKPEDRAKPDADVYLPRPSADPLPFEYFAYDDELTADSTAGPRFPVEFKSALRSGSSSIVGPFVTPEGTGLQMAIETGWKSPCAVLLVRLRPAPRQASERAMLFGVLYLTVCVAALMIAAETEWRIRRVSTAARASARTEYSSSVPVKGKDEIGSMAATFNEAGADIRRRITDVRDREEAMRRLTSTTAADVVEPLVALEGQLGELETAGGLSERARERIREAIRNTHALTSRLQNLAAASTLRMSSELAAQERVDLTSLVSRAVDSHQALARATGMTLTADKPTAPVIIAGDTALVERAVGNLVTNALSFGGNGAHASVRLSVDAGKRFSLRVLDNGPGVSDETLTKITAIRRFRGDEARTQQPDGLGLGLAIVREVGDRLKLTWAFRTAPAGGFEAELAGPVLT